MNYATFKARFTTLLGRRDIVQDTIDHYVELAVTEINRHISADWMEVDAELTADVNGAITPPTGYKKLVSLYTGEFEYRYKRPGEFIRWTGVAGDPIHYTRRAGKWYFVPALAPGDKVRLTYIENNVVPTAEETPLLANAPDLLLHMALFYACLAFKDDRAATFYTPAQGDIPPGGLAGGAIKAINDAQSDQAMSEGPLAVEPSTDQEY